MAYLKHYLSFSAARARGKRCGLLALMGCLCLAGCGDNVRMPTPEERAAFEAAGTMVPTVDMERIRKARLHTGPYRVVPGDVIEFTMPTLLRAVTEAEVRAARLQDGQVLPFICRVSDEGTITLPAVGELAASGKSLAEIEKNVIDAYRRYAVRQPSIYARVLEYRTSKVYIAGAVEDPGVYTLQADQMTLVSLLTEAGGISETGAAVVRILSSERHQETTKRDSLLQDALAPDGAAESPAVQFASVQAESVAHTRPLKLAFLTSVDAAESDDGEGVRDDAGRRSIVLPVVGMNIPFQDMALTEGDTVVVEPVQMPMISLLGLVRNPGNFEYPPQARYNLAQAIGLAGGLQMDVDPRYATVYRLTPDGTILRLPLKLIEDGQYTENLNVPVRPGDLIAVEDTPRTRSNAFLNKVLRVNVGAYIRPDYIWNND